MHPTCPVWTQRQTHLHSPYDAAAPLQPSAHETACSFECLDMSGKPPDGCMWLRQQLWKDWDVYRRIWNHRSFSALLAALPWSFSFCHLWSVVGGRRQRDGRLQPSLHGLRVSALSMATLKSWQLVSIFTVWGLLLHKHTSPSGEGESSRQTCMVWKWSGSTERSGAGGCWLR